MKLEDQKAPVELGPTYSFAPKSTLPSPSGDVVIDALESWQGVFDSAAKRNPTRTMALRQNALNEMRKLNVNLRAKLNQQNRKADIQEKQEQQGEAIKSNFRKLYSLLSHFPSDMRIKIIPEGYYGPSDSADEMEQLREVFELTQNAIFVMSDAILLDAIKLLEKLCDSWIQHKWAKTDGPEINEDLSNYRYFILTFPPEALANLPKESFSDDSSFSIQDKIRFLRRNLPPTLDILRKWFDHKSTEMNHGKEEKMMEQQTLQGGEKLLKNYLETEPSLSGARKRLIAVGWLVICIISIANEKGSYSWGTPSLSWLVLLCATWALIIWLLPKKDRAG